VQLGAFRVAYHVKSSDNRRARIRRHHSREHPQRCGFSCAIRPHQAEDFAGLHVEAQIIDCANSREASRQV
jgi:hypothetical protein